MHLFPGIESVYVFLRMAPPTRQFGLFDIAPGRSHNNWMCVRHAATRHAARRSTHAWTCRVEVGEILNECPSPAVLRTSENSRHYWRWSWSCSQAQRIFIDGICECVCVFWGWVLNLYHVYRNGSTTYVTIDFAYVCIFRHKYLQFVSFHVVRVQTNRQYIQYIHIYYVWPHFQLTPMVFRYARVLSWTGWMTWWPRSPHGSVCYKYALDGTQVAKRERKRADDVEKSNQHTYKKNAHFGN